jgi:hypothetical protein
VKLIGNYSPDFKIVAAISSLNEVILADPFSCHPQSQGCLFLLSSYVDSITRLVMGRHREDVALGLRNSLALK